VRHVRMLGLCLVAVFVVSAVFAASSLATKNPYSNETYTQYKYCPYENEELTDCVMGRTNGGKEGGEFKYGSVRVKLNRPIILQGGFKGAGNSIEVYPAVNGGESLESGEETVVKGLKTLTPRIQELAKWPQALMESFQTAKQNREIKVLAQIEEAGNECFEVPGCLNTTHLLEQKGTAFRLALKVKLTSAWLEKLGGGPCMIGSDEYPVKQELTTGEAGRVGPPQFNEEFTATSVESELVDLHWHISQASGAHGCGPSTEENGKTWEEYIDKALNLALEIENSSGQERTQVTGITWLQGVLYDSIREYVQYEAELGNV
jgi:hypothetical protein